jgi:hypothetical protein
MCQSTVRYGGIRQVGNGEYLYAAIQAIDPRLEAFYNLANAPHLVEFRLQFVDFAQNGSKASDFGIGHLDRITRAVVLHLGCGLGLLRELPVMLAIVPSYHQTSFEKRLGKLGLNYSHNAIAAGSSTSDGQSGRRAPVSWWDPGGDGLGWRREKLRETNCFPVARRRFAAVNISLRSS